MLAKGDNLKDIRSTTRQRDRGVGSLRQGPVMDIGRSSKIEEQTIWTATIDGIS